MHKLCQSICADKRMKIKTANAINTSNMLSEHEKRQIGYFDLKVQYLEEMLEPIIEKQFNKLLEAKRESEEQQKPLLTISDIAKKFGVTKATVHNWRKRGSIVGQKFGKNRYFTQDEVRKSMAKYGFTKIYDEDLDN